MTDPNMTLTISTQALLVIIHQLIRWPEFRRVSVECECWIWVRIGHATKRGEALVVQIAKRDAEVADEGPDLHIMPFNYWMHTHEPRPVIVRGIEVRQELAMRVCPSRSHEYSFDSRFLA